MSESIITGVSCLTRQNLMNFCESWRREISPLHAGKEAAAARSTGLRPIHFSNRGTTAVSASLEAAIITEL